MNLSEINLNDIDLWEAGGGRGSARSCWSSWSSPPCWEQGTTFTSDRLEELDPVTREGAAVAAGVY